MVCVVGFGGVMEERVDHGGRQGRVVEARNRGGNEAGCGGGGGRGGFSGVKVKKDMKV